MALPGTEDAAEKVAAALTAVGFTVGGRTLAFTRARFPKYALTDLAAPKAHVVPMWPARLTVLDDNAGTETETPLAVTIDARCAKTDTARVEELAGLLEAVATFLASKNVAGLGYPIADEGIVIDRDEPALDGGHFRGGVGAVYRLHRNASPPDDDFS